jgi:3-phenylpropionate/trans-cinnamate dioxygenase ferredoxin subunit
MDIVLELSKTGDFEDGTMKEVSADGREILVVRVGDNYYAADNRCPHQGGNLSRGKLEGTVVTCPLHGSQFDITDGRVVRWLKGSGLMSKVDKALKLGKPLTVYSVKVEQDRILVQVSRSA